MTPPLIAESNRLHLEELQSALDRGASLGGFAAVDVVVLGDNPLVLLVSPRDKERKERLGHALKFITDRLFPKLNAPQNILFRGVDVTRLENVVNSGCDRVPTSTPIFASDCASKAMEYGCLVLAYDSNKLDKTYQVVPKSESPETLDRLRLEYQSEKVVEENSIWFSKRLLSDRRIGTDYEKHYSFYIPGDAREALLMLFLLGDDKHKLLSEYVRHTNKPLPPKLQAELADWERKQHEIQIKKEALLAKVRNRKSPTTPEI
jgi:hypothetical protein